MILRGMGLGTGPVDNKWVKNVYFICFKFPFSEKDLGVSTTVVTLVPPSFLLLVNVRSFRLIMSPMFTLTTSDYLTPS